jgi:hypothetical protein
MPGGHCQTGCVNAGSKLSFLRKGTGAKRGSTPFSTRLTNGSGNGLLVSIGTAGLPIVIINRNFVFTGLTGRDRFSLSGIDSIANIVINELIFVMIIPVVVITLI